MKHGVVTIALVASVVAAVSASSPLWAASKPSATLQKQSGFLRLPPAAPAGQMVLYGHIKKLTRKGGHYELRFDPAWFTSGVTASRAALEDTGSGDVPNDNYVVEEGHRLLTYLVPTSARVRSSRTTPRESPRLRSRFPSWRGSSTAVSTASSSKRWTQVSGFASASTPSESSTSSTARS